MEEVNGQVLEGRCNTFTDKLDTEEELQDEITFEIDNYFYVEFNESKIKLIEVIQRLKCSLIIFGSTIQILSLLRHKTNRPPAM